jgi:3-hydroxyisobutyrate dehydrogenase/2-hydroxy-3-oxopropionate reductase
VQYKRDSFVHPEETPVAFSLDLALKDLELIIGLADRLGVPMDQARVNRELIGAAAGRLGGDRDASTVAVNLRQRIAEEGG